MRDIIDIVDTDEKLIKPETTPEEQDLLDNEELIEMGESE